MLAAPLQTRCEVIHKETADHRPASVVCVTGDIDLTSSGQLQAEINDVLAEERPVRLILDLNGMAHIDSSGIGTLLEGWRNASQRHVPFLLCGLNEAARRTLERTRLTRLFDIRRTVEEALRSDVLIPNFSDL